MSQRLMQVSLPEGDVTIVYPSPLSVESVADLNDSIALLLRMLKRTAEAKRDADAEYESWAIATVRATDGGAAP
jgi:uncharacterized small protein (DUF1192 family)